MEITFLGTGAAWGHPVVAPHDCEACDRALIERGRNYRGRSSFVINVANKNILVDAGPDFRRGLLTNQIRNIDAVLVTHSHADHTAGMDDLMPYGSPNKVSLYCSQPVKKVILERGGYLKYNIDFPDIVPEIPFRIFDDSVEITPFSVYHGPADRGSEGSLGFVITYNGTKISYSGDIYNFGTTQLPAGDEDIIPAIFTNPDLLIFETNWFNEPASQPANPHMSFQRAIEYFNRINPGKVILTHISHEDLSKPENHDPNRRDDMLMFPPPINHKQWQKAVSRIYPGTIVAYDGMKFAI